MACSTPVLTVNRGAVLTYLRSGGESHFERGDPGSLADVAARLFAQNLSPVGARARTHVKAAHDWDVVLNRFFDAYSDVLGR